MADIFREDIKLGSQIYRTQKYIEENNSISIVFSCDNYYIEQLCVSLVSLLLNSPAGNTFHIFILNNDITDTNKSKIESLIKVRHFHIEYIQIDKKYFKDLPLNRPHISLATYYRLLLPEILPSHVDKIIYLDCDIVVEHNIADLWNIDIENYSAIVVEDEGSITQINRMKLPLKNNYFNAGIIVFNIQKLRTYDFQTAWKTFYINNQSLITLQDQDILNGVFNGDCKFVSLQWNANGRLYTVNRLEHFYTEQEATNAIYNPYIIHYTDRRKPWKMFCHHPLKSEYTKYLMHTPYAYKKTFYKIKTAYFFTLFYDIARFFYVLGRRLTGNPLTQV